MTNLTLNNYLTNGHEVDVFFAGKGVRILDPKFVRKREDDSKRSTSSPNPLFPKPMFTPMINALREGANLYCSSASVKDFLRYASEGDGALVVADDQIAWSGPPGVIAMATDSDVQLLY